MDIFNLLLDFLIVILLGWTIFVAGKLSRNLATFNKSKKELGILIKEVSSSVEHADKALESFRKDVNETGKGLTDKISEAKMLSDELELIYQSSNRVADRLEKLTETSATKKTGSSASAKKERAKEQTAQKKSKVETEDKKGDKPAKNLNWIKKRLDNKKEEEQADGGIFSIRDPEFEDDLKEDTANFDENWDGPEEIETEAERKLYKALKARST